MLHIAIVQTASDLVCNLDSSYTPAAKAPAGTSADSASVRLLALHSTVQQGPSAAQYRQSLTVARAWCQALSRDAKGRSYLHISF